MRPHINLCMRSLALVYSFDWINGRDIDNDQFGAKWRLCVCVSAAHGVSTSVAVRVEQTFV